MTGVTVGDARCRVCVCISTILVLLRLWLACGCCFALVVGVSRYLRLSSNQLNGSFPSVVSGLGALT